jgi:predicted nucleic acid-binding protein
VIVVDASAIVNALCDRPVPIALIEALIGEDLHAPHLLDYEVAAAFRGRLRGGTLLKQDAVSAVELFGGISIERHGAAPYLDQMLALRNNFTCYDASYVALAQALDAPLVTCDSKFKEAAKLGVDIQVFRNGL